MTYGLGESAIAERIEKWEEGLPKDIKLAYLPSLGRVRLRLSSSGVNMAIIKKAVDIQVKKVIPLIRDIYFGTEEDKPIEVLIGEKLIEKGQTLSCAESCTGGALATRITANSGASKYIPVVFSFDVEISLGIFTVSIALFTNSSASPLDIGFPASDAESINNLIVFLILQLQLEACCPRLVLKQYQVSSFQSPHQRMPLC